MVLAALVKRHLQILTQSCKSLTLKFGYVDPKDQQTQSKNAAENKHLRGQRQTVLTNDFASFMLYFKLLFIYVDRDEANLDVTLGRDLSNLLSSNTQWENMKYTLLYGFEKADMW